MKKVSSFKGQVSSAAAARKKVLAALKRGAKSGGLGFATAEMCHRMVQDSGTWTDMQWLAMEMQIMALGST